MAHYQKKISQFRIWQELAESFNGIVPEFYLLPYATFKMFFLTLNAKYIFKKMQFF